MSVAQGLPQESVIAMTQDAHGYMWLATQTGLARFDGYRTTVFKNDPADPKSLADSWVQALRVDKSGRLWVGSRKGLDRYDSTSGTFVHYSLGQSPNGARYGAVNSLLEDGDDGLWMGTDLGLLRLDVKSGEVRRIPLDLSPALPAPPQVFSMARSSDGAVWIGTQFGILRMAKDSNGISRFATADASDTKSRKNFVRTLLITPDNTIWVGTLDGLQRWRIAGDLVQRQALPDGAPQNGLVSSLYLDAIDTLWAGTINGLFRFDLKKGGTRKYVADKADRYSVADNYVTSLFEDRTGTLWVGTWSGGASRVDLGTGGFERYSSAINSTIQLSDSKVYGVTGDGRGTLWLSTREGGINRMRPDAREIKYFRHEDKGAHSLATDKTLASALDRRGRLWVVTDEGLNVFDPDSVRFKPFPLPVTNSLASTLMCVVVLPSTDEIWVCSRSGTYRIDLSTEQVTTYRHDPANPDSIASDFTTAVLEDTPGFVWIATFGGGLDLFDVKANRFTHFQKKEGEPNSISSNRVQTIFRDRGGVTWVGTSSGINRLTRSQDGRISFKTYTSRDGLAADSIGGVAEDGEGKLWISTTAGISRFDPRSGEFRNYSARDGVTEGSFFIGSVYRDGDGTLYFGGVNGLTAIRPEAVRDNGHPPQAVITDIALFNRSIRTFVPEGFSLDGSLETATRAVIPASLSVFTIEFSALHFSDPARNRFAYKLDGFDPDWNQTSADRRFATYTNLDPGHYTFRVKAANKDGLWSDEVRSLEIVIQPPLWKTWWFKLLVLLGMGSLATFAYRWRIRSLEAQATLLEQGIAERTAQLATALQNLEEASLTDPLTGLNNRRFATQQLDRDASLSIRQFEQATSAGTNPPFDHDLLFFMIDIDYFKQINDQHGHAAGDAVLGQIKARLQAVFRDSDYLVRWGGEEILVVARNADRTSAEQLAERVRSTFASQPFSLAGNIDVTLSCSVGVAALPFIPSQPRALSWSDVITLADMGLYAAKDAGRNGWVVIRADLQAAIPSLDQQDHRTIQAFLKTDCLAFDTNLERDTVGRKLKMRQ